MLTLLLGTDWTANRQEILRRIAKDVVDEQGGRILIVPELISHDTERRLCEAAGDTASRFAEVLSFTRLAGRVLERAGDVYGSCLDEGGRIVAMAAASRQLHSKLKAYASVETRPEFLTGLLDAVDEFKRCCISSKDLMNASEQTQGSFAQKLEELSLLLDTYDGICNQGKKDPRDQMTWVLEELESSTFAQDHVFYIDGFPDFTQQHMAVLEHLIRESKHVIISMNCDKPSSTQPAFEKAGDTAAQILRIAKQCGTQIEIEQISSRGDELSVVCDKLFQGTIDEQVSNAKLTLYKTETPYQECLAAADRISALVSSGARYRDIYVVYTDPSYRNSIERVFMRWNIPVYLSGTEGILDKSVIKTVIAALDTALIGFEQKDVMDYLKSLLSPLDLEMCDKIENYAILWSIQGNAWLGEWKNHPEGLSGVWSDKDVSALKELNDARNQAITPLESLRKNFLAAGNLDQQIRALYFFFEDIDLRNRLALLAQELEGKGDNRTVQILNQLWEILINALEQMCDMLGKTVWDTDTFIRLLKLLLSQYDVGTIPPVLDAVTTGPMNAMRCHQTKHLIILGAHEGAFPGYAGSTGVLTDQERTALRGMGISLTGGALQGLQAEFSDIYGVFCGAEETIAVSCSSGESSFIYRRLRELTGGEEITQERLNAAFGDKLDACAYLSRIGAESVADALDLSRDYRWMTEKREHSLGSISTDNVRKLYGDSLTLSASQIDRQAECRLSYFLKYGLRAKERKAATVDPAEFGTYVHAVLEKTAGAVMDRGGFHKVDLAQTLTIAKQYSQEYIAQRFQQIDTQRLSYLFRRNSQELDLIVEELWKELQNSEFAPVGFEVAFGGRGEMPAISIHGKDMEAQLRGFVDRVDSWKCEDKTYFRIVDYKTGRKDFDYCDVFNGLGLQMLLYLFALEQEGEHLIGENATPAGVQYFPARVPLVNADGLLSDEEVASAREKLWKRKGLILSENAVLHAMELDEAAGRMPFTRKKDGSISGDLADAGQLQMLKGYIFALLGKMLDDIASGCVEPNPYTRGSSHNACTYCPYGSVCHVESVTERRNYKAMSPQRFWEEVEKEVKPHG